MDKREVKSTLATSPDGKHTRMIGLTVLRGDCTAQSQRIEGVDCVVVNGAVWMRSHGAVWPREFKLGADLNLQVYSNRQFNEDLYPLGHDTTVVVARALYMLGYITKRELAVHGQAYRQARAAYRDLREQQEALDNIFDAIGVLGINVVKAEVDARVKMAAKKAK